MTTIDQTQIGMIRVTHWGQHNYFPSREEAENHIQRSIDLNAEDRASRGEPFDKEKWRSEFAISEVERQHQPCKTCGGEAQNKPESYAEYPYCRMCFYTGRAADDVNAEGLAAFKEALPDAQSIGVEHTGGGCFWLAFYWPDDPKFYVATGGEAELPDDWSNGWGYVGRHDHTEPEPGTDYEQTDYYGTELLAAVDPNDLESHPQFTIEQVVAAIRADREARNA
jgi:hypothetical protein